MKKRKYTLFTLGRTWGVGESRFMWYRRNYTRKELVNKIANGILYNRNILDNLVDEPFDVSGRFPGYWDYYSGDKSCYCILKCTGDGYKNVNLESIKDDALNLVGVLRKRRDKQREEYENWSKMYRAFDFREGPVRNVHKTRYHRGSYYRIPQLGSVRRNREAIRDSLETIEELNCSCSFKENRLVDSTRTRFDYSARHMDRSWKTHRKLDKQWMKHLNNHMEIGKTYSRHLVDTEDLEVELIS